MVVVLAPGRRVADEDERIVFGGVGVVAAGHDQVPAGAAVGGELLRDGDDERRVGQAADEVNGVDGFGVAGDPELCGHVGDARVEGSLWGHDLVLDGQVQEFGDGWGLPGVGEEDHAERCHAARPVGPLRAVSECPSSVGFPFVERDELAAHGHVVGVGHSSGLRRVRWRAPAGLWACRIPESVGAHRTRGG